MSGGADEHVLYEMCLPCHLHDEADLLTGVLVGAAEGIHHVELLAGKLLGSEVLEDFPGLLGHGLVVILVCIRSPPYGVLGGLVHYEKFIFRRASGVDTGHYVYGTELCQLSFLITGERGIHLSLVEIIVRGVVDDFGSSGDTVLG